MTMNKDIISNKSNRIIIGNQKSSLQWLLWRMTSSNHCSSKRTVDGFLWFFLLQNSSSMIKFLFFLLQMFFSFQISNQKMRNDLFLLGSRWERGFFNTSVSVLVSMSRNAFQRSVKKQFNWFIYGRKFSFCLL